MQIHGGIAGPARLLSDQAEVADEPRLRRIAEVIDLHHTYRTPARDARYEIGDARLAFPPGLVAIREAVDNEIQQLGRSSGYIENLMVGGTGSQQVGSAGSTVR